MYYTCPVCGFPELEEPAYKGKSGSFEFCQCCGFQFGKTDHDEHISHEEWRAMWIKKGMKWFSSGYVPPENWNPRQQLLNIGVKI